MDDVQKQANPYSKENYYSKHKQSAWAIDYLPPAAEQVRQCVHLPLDTPLALRCAGTQTIVAVAPCSRQT